MCIRKTSNNYASVQVKPLNFLGIIPYSSIFCPLPPSLRSIPNLTLQILFQSAFSYTDITAQQQGTECAYMHIFSPTTEQERDKYSVQKLY